MSEAQISNTSQQNRNNLAFDRAYIANLRDQSPFANGKRNKDFVNPSLVSNVIFYNYGKEKVDNPHVAPNRNKPKANGYDLNGYVAHEPKAVRAHSNPRLDPSKAQNRDYNRPERSYHKSTKSASNKDGPRDNDLISRSSRVPNDSVQTPSKQTDFLPVTDSVISNPGGLICDCCLNDRQHRNKELEKQKQRERDAEMARRLNANMKKLTEDEKKRLKDQKRAFGDAALNQKAEAENLKKQAKDKESEEAMRLRQLNEEKNREFLENQKEQTRLMKDTYISGLVNQIKTKEEVEFIKRERELEEERKKHNVLVQGEITYEMKMKKREEYMQEIRNQVHEEYERKFDELRGRKLEDGEYRRRLKELENEERQRLNELSAKKKYDLKERLDGQMEEKAMIREEQQRQKQQEIEEHKAQLERERQRQLELAEQKKLQTVEHLDTLVNQFGTKENNVKAQKKLEIDHAKQSNNLAKKQLENEKLQKEEKKKAYQDAIVNQRVENMARKQLEKESQEAEKRREREAAEQKLRETQQREQENNKQKKEAFINDLVNQIKSKEELDQIRIQRELEEERTKTNVLVHGEITMEKKIERKLNYQMNIKEQVHEEYLRKVEELNARKLEDGEYRRQLQMLAEEEQNKIRNIKETKKQILKEEITKQIDEKQMTKQQLEEYKRQQDEAERQRVEAEKQKYLDNMFRKKKQNEEYLDNLAKQLGDKEMEKQLQKAEDQNPTNTTLPLGKKPEKNYECSNCHKAYPLKMLNKKVKVPKRK